MMTKDVRQILAQKRYIISTFRRIKEVYRDLLPFDPDLHYVRIKPKCSKHVYHVVFYPFSVITVLKSLLKMGVTNLSHYRKLFGFTDYNSFVTILNLLKEEDVYGGQSS